MTTHKHNLPSFASLISVASIVFYCLGFLRVELQLNEQKTRIDALETMVETKPPSNDPDEFIIGFAEDSLFRKLNRNRRQADLKQNMTNDKGTVDTLQKINKLLSGVRLQLCQSNGDTCPPGPPGPSGPPGLPGEKGVRGRRGPKGRAGNKGDKGIMGSPGKSGKQGIMGPVGLTGEPGIKGQKGDTGRAGIAGAKGEPGESISAPVVAASPTKLTVNESGFASFQCSVSGNPEPALEWSKQGNQSKKISGGKLLLKNVTGNNSGVYKCSGKNILGQAQALVELVVNVRPRVSFHPGPHYAIEGNTFTFPTCHVTGHPAPVVSWRRSSGQLPHGRVRYNSSDLQIFNIHKRDSGLYFCSAKNLLRSVEKETLLVVVSLPRFTVKPPLKVVAWSGEILTIDCRATGDPQPVISWKRQGGQLPVARSQQSNGNITIRNSQVSDAGNYICSATSAGVFNIDAVTYVEVLRAVLSASSILENLDRKYLDEINSFLHPVLQNAARSRFVRCWRATTDGWAASTFHSNCDGKGPTVTIIKVGSYIFGGYTDLSWYSSSCSSASSSKSFIFSLYNINGYAPVKLQIKSGHQRYAIWRCSNYGPIFGNEHDILIANNAASNQNSFTSCGNTYPLPPG